MGTLSLAAPWCFLRTGYELALGFTFSLPFIIIIPQLHYTNSYTYSHPNLNFLQYTIQKLVPHVMWSAQVVRDFKNTPHSMPSIRLPRNPKHVIVQRVGIGTHISVPTSWCRDKTTWYVGTVYALKLLVVILSPSWINVL